MSEKPRYHFPGVRDFVVTDGINPSYAAKIPSLYFVARVVDSVSQAADAKPEHRAAMYEHAREALRMGANALKTAIAAFDDAYKNAPPLPDPDDNPPPPEPPAPPDTSPLPAEPPPPPKAAGPSSVAQAARETPPLRRGR